MVDFKVDIDVLQQLSNQLAEIHDALSTAKSDFSDAAGALHSDKVAGALHTFCDGWKDGRSKIENETASLSEAVAGVAQDYVHGETTISGSFQPGHH